MTYGTMERIQTVTVGSGGAANIEFTNIPQTYSDLKLVLSARTTAAVAYENIQLQFNNSGGTAYSDRIVFSNSQNALSASNTGQANTFFQYAVSSTATASTFSSVDFYIPNYAGSTNKSISVDSVAENNSSTTAFLGLAAELWANTAAITSIKLTPNTGGSTFVQHSTATLYGITRVPAGAKATGGVIYDDSSYWYHVFTSSGTFTPSQNLTCDYLVIAGGGGGGYSAEGDVAEGGGGAGGLVYSTNQSVSSATSITVGGGGAINTNGTNSSISSVTATGGGKGGIVNTNGSSGGSGGGGGGYNSNGGTGTSGQGNNGGNGPGTPGSPGRNGGGGGGAGAAGTTATTSNGGNGGAGSNTYSTWATATSTGISGFYAGGGGGGVDFTSNTGGLGGSGGGGNGADGANATDGAANTGSGGGGGGSNNTSPFPIYNGGAGGSGIVIVRYAK